MTNQNINQVIDVATAQFVNGIQNYLVRQGIIEKIQNGTLKYNVINATPFGNKVKIISSNIKWYRSDDHKITHYFDFNFVFTWKSEYDGFGDYLAGLVGATTYTSLKADIYGAAYRDGQWSGSRLTYSR